MPEPSIEPSGLRAIYAARFSGRNEYRNRVWGVLVDQYFARWIPKSAAVLDLGSGWCEFINHVQANQRFAMDLNPDVAWRAAPGVRVLQQDCSHPWEVPESSLDVVFTSNFLEHLPTRALVEATLCEALRRLKPGGTLIALGPNIRYVGGAYWDFFDHYIPLTEKSLCEVLLKVGFSIVSVSPRFLPYTMSSGRTYPLLFLRLYLKFPLLWKVFGTQFLVIATRPKS